MFVHRLLAAGFFVSLLLSNASLHANHGHGGGGGHHGGGGGHHAGGGHHMGGGGYHTGHHLSGGTHHLGTSYHHLGGTTHHLGTNYHHLGSNYHHLYGNSYHHLGNNYQGFTHHFAPTHLHQHLGNQLYNHPHHLLGSNYSSSPLHHHQYHSNNFVYRNYGSHHLVNNGMNYHYHHHYRPYYGSSSYFFGSRSPYLGYGGYGGYGGNGGYGGYSGYGGYGYGGYGYSPANYSYFPTYGTYYQYYGAPNYGYQPICNYSNTGVYNAGYAGTAPGYPVVNTALSSPGLFNGGLLNGTYSSVNSLNSGLNYYLNPSGLPIYQPGLNQTPGYGPVLAQVGPNGPNQPPPNTPPTGTIPQTGATSTGTSTPTFTGIEFAMQGEVDFRAGKFKEATHAFKHALVDDPRNGAFMMLLAQSLFADGKFMDAAGATQQATQMLPKTNWGTLIANYKELYPNIGDYTTQLRALEKARNENPTDPGLRFLLGWHYGFLGYEKNGITELDKCLELAPKDEIAAAVRSMWADKGQPPKPADSVPTPSPTTNPTPPATNPVVPPAAPAAPKEI